MRDFSNIIQEIIQAYNITPGEICEFCCQLLRYNEDPSLDASQIIAKAKEFEEYTKANTSIKQKNADEEYSKNLQKGRLVIKT